MKSYTLQATIHGAEGTPDASGELPVLAHTLQILCPHPPPCKMLPDGSFQKNDQGNFLYDDADPAFAGGCL